MRTAPPCAPNREELIEYQLDSDPEQVAASKGLYVVYPATADTLQLDLDTEAQFDVFNRRLGELALILDCNPVARITPSKSGLPHRHITVDFPHHTFRNIYHRIAAQFVLGSDPVRETMCFLRATAGIQNPIRFFEKIHPPTKPFDELDQFL